jgi:hypothetical protein
VLFSLSSRVAVPTSSTGAAHAGSIVVSAPAVAASSSASKPRSGPKRTSETRPSAMHAKSSVTPTRGWWPRRPSTSGSSDATNWAPTQRRAMPIEGSLALTLGTTQRQMPSLSRRSAQRSEWAT